MVVLAFFLLILIPFLAETFRMDALDVKCALGKYTFVTWQGGKSESLECVYNETIRLFLFINVLMVPMHVENTKSESYYYFLAKTLHSLYLNEKENYTVYWSFSCVL